MTLTAATLPSVPLAIRALTLLGYDAQHNFFPSGFICSPELFLAPHRDKRQRGQGEGSDSSVYTNLASLFIVFTFA